MHHDPAITSRSITTSAGVGCVADPRDYLHGIQSFLATG